MAARKGAAAKRPARKPAPGKGRTKAKATRKPKGKRNPGGLVIMGANPPKGRARTFGEVVQVRYIHRTEGPRFHDFGPGAVIQAMPDGSLRIRNARKRLWIEE
jgi:hypothetical protein